MREITFNADRVKVSGPLISGDINITFSTGEHEWDKVKDLPNLNGGSIKVTVEEDAKR